MGPSKGRRRNAGRRADEIIPSHRGSPLDRATEAGGQHSRGHLDCLVKVVGVEKILAALAATRDGLGNPPPTP